MVSPRPRDRDATKQALLNALGTVLARDGFTALGVNSVAREAGVDKVLIYRYFGGLEGMVQEFAVSRDFWPGMEDIAGPDPAAFMALPVSEMVAQGLINYARFLRERPLSQAITAWMFVESTELTRAFRDTRQGSFDSLSQHVSQGGENASHIDPTMLGNLLGLTISILVAGQRFPENFHNPLLQDPDNWDCIEDLIRSICIRTLGLFFS